MQVQPDGLSVAELPRQSQVLGLTWQPDCGFRWAEPTKGKAGGSSVLTEEQC